ncbi:MAG: hypothetical protein MUC92_07505 [Fimbriimonadaceae bacterium]|jgi:protein arginine kinase|nr:hypothetical protein [Fimbriimonadaceae bacterium]
MVGVDSNAEAWKKMVLRSMPSPAWLHRDAPEGDVVISSRVRYARNILGFPFPHHASDSELIAIKKEIERGAAACPVPLDVVERLTEAERDYYLGARLISPDFLHRAPGRCLLTDESRMVCAMVNEEDHLRLQVVTAGWSVRTAELTANLVLKHLGQSLTWMESEELGALTASPSNLGEGMRRSALFHLIGLAHSKRLPNVLKALGAWNIVTRGLFGEASRAVGAFVQVSGTHVDLPDFIGACDYLLQEERKSRRDVSRHSLTEITQQAISFAVGSNELTLADALRVLGWVRWAASAGVTPSELGARQIDLWIATMEVNGTQDESVAARQRAVFLRKRCEPLLSSGR